MNKMQKFLYTAFLLCLFPFSAYAYEVSTVSLTSLGSTNLLRVGETSEIGRFRVTNEGRKHLSLESLVLKNYGTARLNESFESINIYHYNNLVASSVLIESKKVKFSFSETLLSPGDSLILSVKGRLIYGRYNKTIELGLKQKEDIRAKEITTGFYANCEECRGKKLKVYRLKSGNVSISRSSYYRPSRYYGSRNNYTSYSNSNLYRYTSSNSYQPVYSRNIPSNYSAGAKGVTFLSSSISSNSGLRVDGMFLALGSGSQVSDKNSNGQVNDLEDFEATFENFRLYVNGYEEGSANGFEERNGQIGIYFSSTIDLPAQNQILVTGRIDNKAADGDKLRLVLDKNSLIDPTYLSNQNTIDLSSINGQIQTRPTQTTPSRRFNIYQVD